MSRKLFVGNLPYSVTSERLGEAFSQFGTVSSSKVIADRETGRSRGFAFLEMETDDQGAAAMQALLGLEAKRPKVLEALRCLPTNWRSSQHCSWHETRLAPSTWEASVRP